MGAMTSGADPEIASAIAEYGEKFGVAFQLSDDLLDIASESTESGKTPGTDLREGIRTLPVLFALAGTDPADDRLRELVSGPITDDDLVAEALTLLRSSSAMQQARGVLIDWSEQARAQLNKLPVGPATDALSMMCDVVVDRSN
jgi:heptaprenyl diphosphate synthase